jgi:hypothetical protein
VDEIIRAEPQVDGPKVAAGVVVLRVVVLVVDVCVVRVVWVVEVEVDLHNTKQSKVDLQVFGNNYLDVDVIVVVVVDVYCTLIVPFPVSLLNPAIRKYKVCPGIRSRVIEEPCPQLSSLHSVIAAQLENANRASMVLKLDPQVSKRCSPVTLATYR